MTRFGQLEFEDDGKSTPKATNNAGGFDKTSQPQGEPPRDAAFCYANAMKFWLGGDFEQALRNFSRAVEYDTTFLGGWLGQVEMLIELGEFPEATLWTDKALKFFPDNPELLAAKGVAAACDARMEQAFAFSDRAIERENAGWRVWLGRAQVLVRKKSNIAQTCISNAISMAGPDVGYVCLRAGRLLAAAGDYRSAIEHLAKAVDLLPKSSLAWLELGICQSRLGRPEAKATIEQALGLRPGWSRAVDELSKCRKRGFFSRLFSR
ncbi:MAG: hypothetical protein A2Y07_11790 [Planctomycetes bacterium GWF2_50_10]|nr:MAG: hypothetical protein A2Y07_11790 [Planctomycetes bacterium GWF2_50_10]